MTVLLPDSIASSNWFFVFSIVTICMLYLILDPYAKWTRTRFFLKLNRQMKLKRMGLWILVFLTSSCFVLGYFLEIYVSKGCPNSIIFQAEIEKLARFVYELGNEIQLNYWVMFGNLLFVLRQQQHIPVGDTDSDIAIEKTHFYEIFKSMNNFSEWIKSRSIEKLKRRVFIRYLEERDLIQLYFHPHFHGSHADIWLYHMESDQYLVNNDRTIRAKKLPYDAIFPLIEGTFVGVSVKLPLNASMLARAEYGPNYMTPLVTRLECMENVWNGYCFYEMSIQKGVYFVMFIVFVNGVSFMMIYSIQTLKQILIITPNIKKKAWQRLEEEENSSSTKDFV
jgi:hypothetical protein